MKVIFRNPVTKTLQVGVIYKKTYGAKGKRYHVINELGGVYNWLASKDEAKDENGYVDFELTELIIPYIDTNLNIRNQANYRDPNFIPSIRKIAID